jgi:hypothetical protein
MMALSHGPHARAVQERMRNSQASPTPDTYSHVIPELHEQAANALDAVLSDSNDDSNAAEQS